MPINDQLKLPASMDRFKKYSSSHQESLGHELITIIRLFGLGTA